MLSIFVLGVLVGLLIGAFVWTALAVARGEREIEQRIRMARRAWEREAAMQLLAPTHPVFQGSVST